ncbi:MAG: nucleoid-associated protein [Acetobacter orientalis]|uniref:nucleoid-associated protein n=1 Tax=Acetobacter orientalis TaxID=146474 RepID=UPI0039E8FEDE
MTEDFSHSINHVAVHDLKKIGKHFSVILGHNELSITPVVIDLIDEIHNAYKRKTSKLHGEFSEDVNYNMTKIHLNSYYSEEISFSKLTELMMNTLQSRANGKSNVNDGHIFFADFEKEEKKYFLVVIVDDKLGAKLTDDLNIQRITHLDMDGFRFAGQIDVTSWLENKKRYLGFLQKKGEVSHYFQEFLGCTETIKSREDTKNLIVVLKKYANAEGYDFDQASKFLLGAKIACQEALQNGYEVSFETLSNILSPDDPERLRTVLADPENKLTDFFTPDKITLNTLVGYKGKTKTWKLEFVREAIANGDIQYKEHDNIIIIKNLPEELQKELQKEYNQKDE